MYPALGSGRRGAHSARKRLRHGVQPLIRAVLAVLAGLLFASVAPALAGWQSAVVLTGSMQPAIRPGDIVVSDPDSRRKITPGSVVVVRTQDRPGETLVHRVVSRETDGSLILRGDANQTNDSTPVPPDNVVGVVRLSIGWVGLPVVWWHQRQWHLVGAAAVVLLLLVAAAQSARPAPAAEATDDAQETPEQGEPGLAEEIEHARA